MASFVKQADLRNAAPSYQTGPEHRDEIADAIRSRSTILTSTAFLSHSHKDRELAIGLEAVFKSHGIDLYIDWMDDEMPSSPNQETAKRIKDKIEFCDWFLFLATENSKASKWCPWEIGFADKAKGVPKVLIVPTEDIYGTYGSEYLNLYPHLDMRRPALQKASSVFGLRSLIVQP